MHGLRRCAAAAVIAGLALLTSGCFMRFFTGHGLDEIVAEVRSAVAWVIEHARELGGDPGRVFVSGHSAGGHLTAVAMDDERVAGGVATDGSIG